MPKLPSLAGIVVATLLSTTAMAQSATEAQSDPAKLTLAQEMFAAQGGQEALQARMKSMFDAINTQMMKSMPPEQQKFALPFQTNMQNQTLLIMSSIMQDTLRVYARNLTEQELRDELAWLKSPSGQSIQQKLPLIQREVLAEIIPVIMKALPGATRNALEATCAQEHCTAKDHTALAQTLDRSLPHGS